MLGSKAVKHDPVGAELPMCLQTEDGKRANFWILETNPAYIE